jgi:GGDEF domain-containing protein
MLERARDSQSLASDRWDRFPPPHRSGWCADLRDDPITGLVAWPQFETALPLLLERELRAGRTLGFAIGDCDEFKTYVETERIQDPRAWGHQVGNKVMGQLGSLARWWLAEQSPVVSGGVLATFGGDEVIVIVDVTEASISKLIEDLRDRFRERLPVTVSFAYAELGPQSLPENFKGGAWMPEWTSYVIGGVDRALFGSKRARRDEGADIPFGFVVPATLE